MRLKTKTQIYNQKEIGYHDIHFHADVKKCWDNISKNKKHKNIIVDKIDDKEVAALGIGFLYKE